MTQVASTEIIELRACMIREIKGNPGNAVAVPDLAPEVEALFEQRLT